MNCTTFDFVLSIMVETLVATRRRAVDMTIPAGSRKIVSLEERVGLTESPNHLVSLNMPLSLDDFIDDTPWTETNESLVELRVPDQIDGVTVRRLVTQADGRGGLTVLFSSRIVDVPPPPHVYSVEAAPHSVRAWVYHKRQADRLAFTNGYMRVVLYDIRPGSSTFGKLNIIEGGSHNRIQVTIPPLVIHGVQNIGDSPATFVNMPTNAYDPSSPDKSRLPNGHPGIPFSF